MARTELITCDVCGIQRKEANHWFRFRHLAMDVSFYPAHSPNEIDLHPFSDACSEACCMTVLSRTLSSWSKTPEEAR
ncbi:hypothetical protein HDF17_000175 [Granulicella arctica]|uniref:Uncharacterized protein n=1 Tax=Granulicella arctica TaxID=940613 RepID=A0A7Y9PDF2_9BACT|nr:hypothetical protein [Granulicella arctica]